MSTQLLEYFSIFDRSIIFSILPNDVQRGSKKYINRLSQTVDKMKNGSGALTPGSRDNLPSRTATRVAMTVRKHTSHPLWLLYERRVFGLMTLLSLASDEKLSLLASTEPQCQL